MLKVNMTTRWYTNGFVSLLFSQQATTNQSLRALLKARVPGNAGQERARVPSILVPPIPISRWFKERAPRRRLSPTSE